MFATSPFLPLTVNGSVGKTVLISATLSPGTVAVLPTGTTAVMVQVQAPTGAAAYIRISTESSTAIQASNVDTPIFGAGTAAATVIKLFAAAGGAAGPTTVAIAASVTSSAVNVWLTPGLGGFGP